MQVLDFHVITMYSVLQCVTHTFAKVVENPNNYLSFNDLIYTCNIHLSYTSVQYLLTCTFTSKWEVHVSVLFTVRYHMAVCIYSMYVAVCSKGVIV